MAPEYDIFHPKHLGRKITGFSFGTFWNINNNNKNKHFNCVSETQYVECFHLQNLLFSYNYPVSADKKTKNKFEAP